MKHNIDIELSAKEWLLLAQMVEDYNGLYSIPHEFFQAVIPGLSFEDEVPPNVRQRLETEMSQIYEKLYNLGFIEVYSVALESHQGTILSPGEALDQMRNPQNYDWRAVTDPYIAVATSDAGVEYLERTRAKYYGR